MAITYTPKVGEVLECNFGDFKRLESSGTFDEKNYDGRIPNEMIKRRMVVVINAKLDGNCLVVPISSTKRISSIKSGHHVPLDKNLFRITDFYDKRDRWAKAETIQLVSKKRLFKLKDNNSRFDLYFPRETVTSIQKAIIKTINANALIDNGR